MRESKFIKDKCLTRKTDPPKKKLIESSRVIKGEQKQNKKSKEKREIEKEKEQEGELNP